MRELDIAIVGAGRLGTALAAALGAPAPLGRGFRVPPEAGIVLLCVPDGEIAAAARAVPPGPLVGHCSGATTLQPILAAGHEAFSLHPLMTVPKDAAASFHGAGAAVAGSSDRALRVARELAERLGMNAAEIADGRSGRSCCAICTSPRRSSVASYPPTLSAPARRGFSPLGLPTSSTGSVCCSFSIPDSSWGRCFVALRTAIRSCSPRAWSPACSAG
jgi:hypothetical protein